MRERIRKLLRNLIILFLFIWALISLVIVLSGFIFNDSQAYIIREIIDAYGTAAVTTIILYELVIKRAKKI